jgi:sn-glycerol 3-phosphate transport system ATP-binding protein
VAEIRLTQVTKSWGGEPAVDHVSFAADAGNLLVLLGPSGCGKSTTLRLIAGLELPDAGTIEIAGRNVTREPPARRGVAMVFQSYALFPHLSVAENITFGLKVRHVGRAERSARLKRASELLGLERLLDRKPSQLSGGQQQRVALGRALVAQTPVCLMDEPLSNLDAQLRSEMRREIRSLQRRLGITMVYVTHDQVEAMTMADRVILMRAGMIQQNGKPASLYERPQTVFTARFIGSPPMNVLPAKVLAGHGALAGAAPGRELAGMLFGVRAEALRIASAGLPARVIAVEYLGGDSQIEARVGEESVLLRAAGTGLVGPGDEINLAWAPTDAHWFDASSGCRIA